jgi:hypothetical protein
MPRLSDSPSLVDRLQFPELPKLSSVPQVTQADRGGDQDRYDF